MGLYKQVINPITGKCDLVPSGTIISFKDSVANAASLPATGNSLNDARITDDTGHLYVWNGTSWVDQGDIVDLEWSAINGKPSSTPANIDDAVSKKHTQNTDEYLTTQITHKLYVDGNRIDTYTEDGSFTKPFKKIQDAIDAASGATAYNRITIQIMPGQYLEQIVMKAWVHLVALVPDSVWIQSAVGDVVTTSVDANMTNISIEYTGTDNIKVGLRCNNGAILVAREVSVYASYTGVVLESGAIFIEYGGGTLTGEADSFIVKNGAYAAFYSTTLSGWGAPYYDLTIEAGGYVDVMDIQLYNERLNNLGTLNLVTPASRIKNDSTVTGDSVKDALETLDSTKYTENNEIKIKLYSQDAEPTLAADNNLAIWIDTDDSNRVYLLYRRGSGDQVAVELG